MTKDELAEYLQCALDAGDFGKSAVYHASEIIAAIRQRPEGGASIHPAVRVALRVVLNHVEPGHENCTALLTAWLDGRLEPQPLPAKEKP